MAEHGMSVENRVWRAALQQQQQQQRCSSDDRSEGWIYIYDPREWVRALGYISFLACPDAPLPWKKIHAVALLGSR